MSRSHLTTLIQQPVSASVISVFQRTIDATAEQLATELLKDSAFRAELQQLVRHAFTRTMRELNESATESSE